MRILLLINEHIYSNIILREFIRQNHKRICGIIDSDFIVPKKSFFGSIVFIIKKSPFLFSAYKFFEGQVYKFKIIISLSNLKFFKTYSKIYKIPLYKTKDVNGNKTTILIKKLSPDVIYCIGFAQKLGKEILDIPKFGCINFHPSLLPSYRGLFPYFWVIAKNEKQSGVSFHLMDEEWDRGKILVQRILKVRKNESMQMLFFRCATLASSMLINLQNKIDKNNLKPIEQKPYTASYYGWVTRTAFKEFKKNGKRLFRIRELWESI